MNSTRFMILLAAFVAEISFVSSWSSFIPLRVPRIPITKELTRGINSQIMGLTHIITLNDTKPFWGKYEKFPECFVSQQSEYVKAIKTFKVSSTEGMNALKKDFRRNHHYLIYESIDMINQIASDMEKFRLDVLKEITSSNFNKILDIMKKYRLEIYRKFFQLYVDIINLNATGSDNEKKSLMKAQNKVSQSMKNLQKGTEEYVRMIKDCIKMDDMKNEIEDQGNS